MLIETILQQGLRTFYLALSTKTIPLFLKSCIRSLQYFIFPPVYPDNREKTQGPQGEGKEENVCLSVRLCVCLFRSTAAALPVCPPV